VWVALRVQRERRVKPTFPAVTTVSGTYGVAAFAVAGGRSSASPRASTARAVSGRDQRAEARTVRLSVSGVC
jgi:hypothetical protein